jgi:hypothetical protein
VAGLTVAREQAKQWRIFQGSIAGAVLQNWTCISLMRDFIAGKPELQNEDIGQISGLSELPDTDQIDTPRDPEREYGLCRECVSGDAPGRLQRIRGSIG